VKFVFAQYGRRQALDGCKILLQVGQLFFADQASIVLGKQIDLLASNCPQETESGVSCCKRM